MTTTNETMVSFASNGDSYAGITDTTINPYVVSEPEEVEYAPEIPAPVKAYIYPSSIKNVSSGNDTEYLVDIEFFVSCYSDTSAGSDYKLTKRLKFDKNKLIQDAKAQNDLLNTTAKVVENKNEKSINQRMLELAGVKHPKNYV